MVRYLISEFVVSISAGFARVLVDSGVKSTLLLVIATLLTWVLHRASAAIRDRIWTLAFCGTLILPVVSSIVPQWRVSLPGMRSAVDVISQPELRHTTRGVQPRHEPRIPLENEAQQRSFEEIVDRDRTVPLSHNSNFRDGRNPVVTLEVPEAIGNERLPVRVLDPSSAIGGSGLLDFHSSSCDS